MPLPSNDLSHCPHFDYNEQFIAMRQLLAKQAQLAANIIGSHTQDTDQPRRTGNFVNSERIPHAKVSEPASKPCLGRSTLVQTKTDHACGDAINA